MVVHLVGLAAHLLISAAHIFSTTEGFTRCYLYKHINRNLPLSGAGLLTGQAHVTSVKKCLPRAGIPSTPSKKAVPEQGGFFSVIG